MVSSSILVSRRTKKAINSRMLFYIGMMIFLGSIFARNVLNFPVPSGLILLFASLIAFVSDRDEIFALVVASMVTGSAFQYKYFILIAIIAYIVKFGKDIKYKGGLIPLILMLLWELAHGIGYNFSFYEYFRGFAELMLCTMVMMCEKRKINYAFIVRTLSVCTIFMFSIVLINLLKQTNFDFSAIFNRAYRFGIGNTESEHFGANYNPNGVGSLANMCTVGLLQLNLANNKKKIDYLMIALLLFFGILSMSRAFLVVLAVVIFLFILASGGAAMSKIKKISACIAAGICLVIAVAVFAPAVLQNFIARFNVDDISNGRIALFAFYHNHIFSNFKHMFFGIGIQDFAEKISSIYGGNMEVCHNGIQEVVVCWGFVGLIFFFAFVKAVLSRQGINFKRTLTNYIPFIVFFITVQSGQLIRSGGTFLTMLLCYISLNSDMKEIKSDE